MPSKTTKQLVTTLEEIRAADAALQSALETAAKSVQANAEIAPILLLSGPSGSGKTTSSYFLRDIFQRLGTGTHTISMDHFFKTMTPEEHRAAEAGEIDLESPDRVDVAFLNKKLLSVVSGEPTWMPHYNFAETSRDDAAWLLTRKPGEILILEGIHALNPDMITIPDRFSQQIFISVQTSVRGENGGEISPEQLRLLRRILRDKFFRDRPAADTIAMFPSVQRGEMNFIMPYVDRAYFSIDTFLPYELGVYRTIFGDADMIFQQDALASAREVWSEIPPVKLEDVPETSLAREFIGGGCFTY